MKKILLFSILTLAVIYACARSSSPQAPAPAVNTPTYTMTPDETATAGAVLTMAAVINQTNTAIAQATQTYISSSFTPTFTQTHTLTETLTITHSSTYTAEDTLTFTETPTVTETSTASATPTLTQVIITNVGGIRYWADGTRACNCAAYLSPASPYVYAGATGDGIYSIKPSTTENPVNTWCDMTMMGGGWTLVLLNSPYATPPKPTWADLLLGNNITGDITAGLNSFDMFLGAAFWNLIGTTLMIEAGSNHSNIDHRATYTFSLNPSNFYAISLSNEALLITTGGTASPGLYTSHNGMKLSSRDMDNDTYVSSCSSNYAYTAWWYSNCWSGSFWGGGGAGGFANAPYWTGSATEYFAWGAIWIK